MIAALAAMLALACASTEGEVATGGESAAAAADTGDDVPTDQAGYQLKQTFDLNIQVTSTVFNEKRRIPKKNACVEVEFIKGVPATNLDRRPDNTSPPLSWGELPAGTVSIALIVDSDQGTTVGAQKPADLDPSFFDKLRLGAKWVHWVMWNIPAEVRGLPQGVPTSTNVVSVGPNTQQGTNSESQTGWYGPCPPPAVVVGNRPATDQVRYTYIFKVYALDIELEGLGPETTKDNLLRAIDGHILGVGEAVGEHTARIIKK
jgi:Raf kinase inhibitor-like YbhB/YbcL family protein